MKKKGIRKGRNGTGWGEVVKNVERSGTDEAVWARSQQAPDSVVADLEAPQLVQTGPGRAVSVWLVS